MVLLSITLTVPSAFVTPTLSTKAVRKHLARKGLISLYRRRRGRRHWLFRWFIHRLFALPFAPPTLVRHVYKALKKKIRSLLLRDPKVALFVRYFEKQWVYKRSLPRSAWNVYEVRSHRTNNNIEGTHLKFLSVIGVRANMWLFLELLQQYEEIKMLEEARHRKGFPPTRRRKKYRDKEARLASLRDLFEMSLKTVRDASNYISAVSKLFRYL
jgi:hypothetical protein